MTNETNVVDINSGKVNIQEFTDTDAALAGLREEYSEIPDVHTKDGYAIVKAGCTKLTGLRTAIEKRRKEVKEPYLNAGSIIDAEARRITGELVKIEGPLKDAKKAADDKEKLEKANRIARLQEKVDAIRGFVSKARGQSSGAIAELIAEVDAIDAQVDFYDLTSEAITARSEVLDQLNEIYTDRLQFEISEAERLQLEQEQKDEARERALENKVNELKMMPVNSMGKSSDEIRAKINELSALALTEADYGEKHAEVVELKDVVIAQLESLFAGAVALEEQQKVEPVATEQPAQETTPAEPQAEAAQTQPATSESAGNMAGVDYSKDNGVTENVRLSFAVTYRTRPGTDQCISVDILDDLLSIETAEKLIDSLTKAVQHAKGEQ